MAKIISPKTPFLIGGALLLFVLFGCLAIYLSGDTETIEILSAKRFWLSALVIVSSITIGALYTPQHRKTASIVVYLMSIIFLIVTLMASNALTYLLPLLAVSTVIIECVSVFWPVKITRKYNSH